MVNAGILDKDDREFDIYADVDLQPTDVTERYKGYMKRKVVFIIGTVLVLFCIVIYAAGQGTIDISFFDTLRYIFTFDNSGEGRIVWNIRMVRILAALMVGAGLAVSGVVMQSILRNPLASPYTLGLSSAAAFGAAFAIMFLQGGATNTSSIDFSNPYIVTICAFLFSMLATAVILLLTRITKVTAETLVLAGVAINAIFAAALSALQYFSNSIQLSNMVSWTFGDLGRASWMWNELVFLVLLPVTIFFIYNRWTYNAIDAGEETAQGLGINTGRERIVGMVLSAFLCSILVSFFGIIAFIGLLGPHIARMLIGGDHRYLIPAAMVIGSIILLLSDTLGRLLLAPAVIPVGIITSMLGGPMFIYLLIRRKTI